MVETNVNITVKDMSVKVATVYGVGINDSNTPVRSRLSGHQCPYYHRWHKMLTRCYSPKMHIDSPTYKDCSVCDEWLLFSNFRDWMKSQDWCGKELDKDILNPGNKIYSPDNCVFVEQHLNKLFCKSSSIRGDNPIGVCYSKQIKRYVAYLTYKNKRIHIGTYKTKQEAGAAYIRKKIEVCEIEINSQTCGRIKSGIRKHINLMLQGVYG